MSATPLSSLAVASGFAADGATPCPFCGCTFIRWINCGDFPIHGETSQYRRLVCYGCGSGTTPYPPDALDQCLARWNGRVLTAQP